MFKLQIKNLAAMDSRRLCLLVLSSLFLLVLACSVEASPPDLKITGLQLVSSKRISLSQYEYTYRASLRNDGGEARDVVATVGSTPTQIEMLDGLLSFGLVGAGQTVISSNTFTVRHDRKSPFKESMVAWIYDYSADALPFLDGFATDLAVNATRDFYNGDGIEESELVEDPKLGRIVRTKSTIRFKTGATVADVNDVLAQTNGRITGMLAGTARIVIRLPDPGSVANLETLINQMKSNPQVESVTHVRIAEPMRLPDNSEFDPITPDPLLMSYIDHHLAIKSHALWNAEEAFEKYQNQFPIMMIGDHFGNGPIPSNDENGLWGFRKTYAKEYASNTNKVLKNTHGYQVASVIGGSLGGVGFDGLVTGLSPGLELHVLDRLKPSTSNKFALSEDEYMIVALKRLQVIAKDRRVVLNESFGTGCWWFKTCGTQRVMIDTETNARDWIEGIRSRNLESKVLLVTGAGNTADWSKGDPGYSAELLGRSQRALLGKFQSLPNPPAPLTNGLVVENHMNLSLTDGNWSVEPGCRYNTSNLGGHLAGIGSDVLLLTEPGGNAIEDSGTSFSAPQVAGLSAYLWSVQPWLKAQDIVERIKNTVQLAPNTSCDVVSSEGGIVDAYAAILTMDKDITQPANAPIRMAILDVAGPNGPPDGKFDEFDLKHFLDMFALYKSFANGWNDGNIYAPDFSRYDLNGDGFTDAPATVGGVKVGVSRFDLDQSYPFITPTPALPNAASYQQTAYQTVYQQIEGHTIGFNEAALTDVDILIYYAYSPLWQGDNSNGGTRELLLLERFHEIGLKLAQVNITWTSGISVIAAYDPYHYFVVPPVISLAGIGTPESCANGGCRQEGSYFSVSNVTGVPYDYRSPLIHDGGASSIQAFNGSIIINALNLRSSGAIGDVPTGQYVDLHLYFDSNNQSPKKCFTVINTTLPMECIQGDNFDAKFTFEPS